MFRVVLEIKCQNNENLNLRLHVSNTLSRLKFVELTQKTYNCLTIDTFSLWEIFGSNNTITMEIEYKIDV